MKRIIPYFLLIGAVLLVFPFQAQALQSNKGDEFCYFCETFSDKSLRNNIITDAKGKTVWQINTTTEQTNAITDTGELELGNSRYMQRAVLNTKYWENKSDYAMEFTVNIQKDGNEGHCGRPIAVIIPRSKNSSFKEYYAVTYYMENTVANQFRFKWAIINTAAPTGMKPLVEGYYLLQENVDYTGRLLIQNTEDGNVSIQFYLDGPTNPVKEFKPLLSYTDSSEYKITSGVTGPAFGTVGYSDDGWGTSPIVRYDNIKLYDPDRFLEYAEQLKKFAGTNPQDIESDEACGEIKYVINKGIISGYSDNQFKPDTDVTVAEFLKMLMAQMNETVTVSGSDWVAPYVKRGMELGIIKENEFTDYNRPVTRYEMALMLTRLYSNPRADQEYASFISDFKTIPYSYQNAALYTFEKGYLRLDDDFAFLGSGPVSRKEAALVMLRMIDSGYRKVNYNLELPSILSSGAVLQGNKKIPVWGRGICGETVTVSLKDQTKTTTVKNGYWYVELDPMSYGGPYILAVKDTKKAITLKDVWVGEVFIVAGQSNAEMFLCDSDNRAEAFSQLKKKTNLRFYWGEQITSVTPNFTSEAAWESTADWVLNSSPAVGTFFVQNLLKLNSDLNGVAIGVIRMTYGGTTIQAFMPNCITEEENYVQKDDEPIMSGFWNGFMAPISPYAIRGLIYYQGENSAQLGYEYEPLLRDYLRGIRTAFLDPDLPIMLVQLAGYGYNHYQLDVDEWPVIREVQMKVANSIANTGLVTAVDLADPDPIEIHPKNKGEVGRRLAYLAMGLIYGKDIEKSSAKLNDYQFEGNKVTVSFSHDFGKLYFKDNVPLDFQVLDFKGKWHMANAKINNKNNTVNIWSDEVAEPIGVRYAWVNYPNAALYNNAGMPALPFKVIAVKKTTENIIKITNHSLAPNDAIVNTKKNQFRVINVIDENTIMHEYAIAGQAAGNRIERLTRMEEVIAQAGTTETIIKINHHGLVAGDWIRNDTRGWLARKVLRVIDENTIEIEALPGQTAGDEIEGYRYSGEMIAE